MEIIQNLEQYYPQKPLVLSIGMFDGVHRGHQEIIHKINNIAQEMQWESAILTFTPHPRLVFNPNDNLKLLNTLDEKIYLLDKANIQNLFIQNFDENFRNISGEDFIREILVKKLNVKYLIIGHDHTFGKNKSGDFRLLKQLSSELGYQVEQIDAFNLHHQTISSTKIRNALLNSNILEANNMLNYHYAISGEVINGKKLGRTIGYPTANIRVEDCKLLPKNGAYIVDVFIDNYKFKGMLSIGTNPTVNGKNISVEVHILDFRQDIYGKNIRVEFRDFLHEEIKFESLEGLIQRLDKDKKLTEDFFSN